jgi:uncharacterized protein (TIGR03067 family)
MARTVAAAVLAMAAAAADPPRKELEPFQGTWAVVSFTQNGMPVPDDEVRKLSLVVTEDERVIKAGDEVRSRAKFSIDPAKTPKTIDIAVSDGPLAGRTVRGIYELKDGTLTVCLSLAGDDRPDDLTAPEGSDRLLQVFKRADAKPAPKPAAKEPKLREELLNRMKEDQAGRVKLIELAKKHGGPPAGAAKAEWDAVATALGKVDEANTAWLKGVVDKHGWPGHALVGTDGAQAAFLLVQHADRDREFQKKCLPLLAAAVERKDAQPSHLAYLTDRVRLADGEKQVYGTQLRQTGGELKPAPIEDEANVDARRKAVGLPPLADYLKMVRSNQGVPKKG